MLQNYVKKTEPQNIRAKKDTLKIRKGQIKVLALRLDNVIAGLIMTNLHPPRKVTAHLFLHGK